MRYSYAIQLEAEPDGSAVNLSFPDVPGALTFGDDATEALALAEDCLIAALRGYMKLGKAIPVPSAARGRPVVILPSLAAAKLALYAAMREARISNVELARRLGVTENVVRKLLDLDHRSHIGQVEAALGKLGVRLEVVARKAA
jgi:antitoxin HicB